MGAEFVVFTDLDGTLLDHESYSYEAARPLLELLTAEGIPVVLASSKTAAEIAPLRAELGLSACPAIVENGAGLLPPGQERPAAARTHDRLRAALDALPGELRALFRGFSDWSAAEIARRTGLTPEAAALAAQRDFSEPGLFSGSAAEREEFTAVLAEAGITAVQGGRFLTLSFGAAKADRMAEVAARYPGATTVALGDAPNDIAMLQAADYAVVVPNPAHAALPPLAGEATGRIRRAPCPGPAGWAAGLGQLLAELRQTSE
ncbi:HAD-IIB family hydrolase [Acidimangrovimonas pyrenivorans]|uniref:HAD-IIB family hydrolase n=1 Tax=Acidimangrovimonas pyrenivorans TaxID=2030798 RepID=A0ABV7ADJ6_9RHOB